MKILVIIPCYNEEKNIEKTVNSLIKNNLDYVIINDGSKDNSLNVIRKNNFNCVNLSNNLGIGAAVQTGYKYAKEHSYDIAIQFDGDGQHDVNYINKIVEPIKNKEADMVIGSRFVGNESEFKSTQIRRVGINLLSFLLKLISGEKIKDMTSGFRAVNKEIIELFAKDYPQEYPEPVTNLSLAKRKFKIKEVPVKMKEREHGKSSINAIKSIYYMFNVILLFTIIGFTKGDDKHA